MNKFVYKTITLKVYSYKMSIQCNTHNKLIKGNNKINEFHYYYYNFISIKIYLNLILKLYYKFTMYIIFIVYIQ
jgi:hypothetical protein